MKETNETTVASKILATLGNGNESNASTNERAIRVGRLRGEELRRAVRELDWDELLAFLAFDEAGRAKRIAAVAALDDVDVLVALAVSAVPTFVRRNALHRIEEVLDGGFAETEQIERLLPCLEEEGLIARAVSLMDESGFDWCARCGREVVHVLCAAMSGCRSIDESILLEDAFAQLAHSRPELRVDLRACTPESFIPRSVYSPMIASGSLLVDNVA